MFVPLAAFDRRGGRIGFGAGYYDCTLAALRARRAISAVGVAFSTSEVESVPAEPPTSRSTSSSPKTNGSTCQVRPMRPLYIGDVIGRSAAPPSRPRAQLRQRWGLDFVGINGENAAGGLRHHRDDLRRVFRQWRRRDYARQSRF